MSDSAQREWRFYIDGMIGFAEKVIAYTAVFDQAGVIAGGLNYDATLRNPVPSSGAATYDPAAARTANPQFTRRLATATRDRLTPGCLGTDNGTLSGVIQGDVPAVLPLPRAFGGILS